MTTWADEVLKQYDFEFTRTLGEHGARFKSKRDGVDIDIWTNGSWKFVKEDWSGKKYAGLEFELEKRYPQPVIANLSACSICDPGVVIVEGFYCTVDGVPYGYCDGNWTRIGFPSEAK